MTNGRIRERLGDVIDDAQRHRVTAHLSIDFIREIVDALTKRDARITELDAQLCGAAENAKAWAKRCNAEVSRADRELARLRELEARVWGLEAERDDANAKREEALKWIAARKTGVLADYPLCRDHPNKVIRDMARSGRESSRSLNDDRL